MDLKVNFKGGGSITSHAPVFTPDGENVFVSWKNSILEYNTKTGKLIHEYSGLADRVVGFDFLNFNSCQCITACSVSGQVMVWKVVTHFNIFEKKLPINNIKTFHVIPLQNSQDFKAVISNKEDDRIKFSVVNIKTSEIKAVKLKVNSYLFELAISGNDYFCVTQNNQLFYVNLKNLHVQCSYIQNNRKFTCVACHPTNEIVLTGDNSGRVIVWHNVSTSKPIQAIFHWHTLPVNTVCFSTAGSYFYSGADECVLVKWQLENALEKSFLPRLPAPIKQIKVSNNNLFIALATSDNAIRILDSRMNYVSLIQHLVVGNQFNCGIIYDPRTKSLVMNGNIGHIQFYSPEDKSLLYNVDIVGQNKITSERNCNIRNTEITKMALSKSGLWMATVEERLDSTYHNEIRLKFWKFDSAKQMFELNTSMEYPHEKSITNILFQPLLNEDELKCVTVSDDNKFKVWQLTEVSSVYRKGVAWKCFGVGYYRDLPCKGLSFSIDGSLMATGFGSILTTWLPDTCELKCSLVHPNYRLEITHVEFGKSNDCHLIVATSQSYICVWNLLSLTMVWTAAIDVSFLIVDSFTSNMAVVSKNKKIVIFTPDSPNPIYTSDKVKKKNKIITAAFVPTKYSNDVRLPWSERSSLYFINSFNELFSLSSGEETTNLFEDTENNQKSMFNMMIPNQQTKNVKSLTPSRHLYEKDHNHKNIKNYLEAPLHTMVPIRLSCESLLKSLVVQKENLSTI